MFVLKLCWINFFLFFFFQFESMLRNLINLKKQKYFNERNFSTIGFIGLGHMVNTLFLFNSFKFFKILIFNFLGFKNGLLLYFFIFIVYLVN